MDKKILITICSKSPNEILYNNILKLKEFYSEAKIIIIDSDSSDFYIYNKIKNEFNDIEIHYIKNKNYEYGAWKSGYSMYPNYDIYICIQDSIIINKYIDFSHITSNDAFIIYHISGFNSHIEIKPHALSLLENTKLNYNNIIDTKFILAQHSSFIVTNERLNDMLITLCNPPINKEDSCAYERIFGLYFILKNINTINISNYINKTHGKRI